MQIKIKKLNPEAKLPSYAHDGDAGMDVYSFEEFILESQQRYSFKTGFAMEFAKGHVALVKDKSGLAKNHGIHCLAGVIDSSYRGEVEIVLINLDSKNYQIKKGDKIAQIVILPIPKTEVVEVQELSDTARGEGGFGSTGLR